MYGSPYYYSNSSHDYNYHGDYYGYNNYYHSDPLLIGGGLTFMPFPFDSTFLNSPTFSTDIFNGFYSDVAGLGSNIDDMANSAVGDIDLVG